MQHYFNDRSRIEHRQMPPKKDLAVIAKNREEIELIKNTVARGATDTELKLFLYTAQRTGLDPLTRQIFFIKRRVWNRDHYDEVGTIQTGIDGYRAVATRTKQLAGEEDAVFDTEENTHPNKASVTVYRMVEGQKMSFTASARWSEYVQLGKDGMPANMWKKMPYLMLAKCAAALAYRKAFPNDLSGVYTSEEMSQADNSPVEPTSGPTAQKPVKTSAKVKPRANPDHSDVPIIDEDTPTGTGADDAESHNEAFCPECNGPISPAEVSFSTKKYGKPMCRNCQKGFNAGQQ